MEPQELVELGDHPALALVNSITAPGRGALELITDGPSYVTWLQVAGLIDDDDRQTVLGRFGPDRLDAVADEAVRLREWLRPVVATWAAGHDLPRDVPERLNEILALDRRHLQILMTDGGSAGLGERRDWHTPRQLLAPPVAAAAELLTTGVRDLVRPCEGPDCTLWFYDRTKSHRRRWCSMAACGNRAKARKHRSRTAGGTGPHAPGATSPQHG